MTELDRPPAIAEAAGLWWRARWALAQPILLGWLLAAPAAAMVATQGASPRSLFLMTIATLVASWLGLAFAGALAAADPAQPVDARAAWRAVAAAGWRLWVLLVARCCIVYGPMTAFVALAQRQPVAQEVGQPNLVPAAALILWPMSIVLAALFALVPATAVREPGLRVVASLERSRLLGDRVFARLLIFGGIFTSLAMVFSLVPVGPVRFFPNHLIGSFVWVLVAVHGERARERDEPRAA